MFCATGPWCSVVAMGVGMFMTDGCGYSWGALPSHNAYIICKILYTAIYHKNQVSDCLVGGHHGTRNGKTGQSKAGQGA